MKELLNPYDISKQEKLRFFQDLSFERLDSIKIRFFLLLAFMILNDVIQKYFIFPEDLGDGKKSTIEKGFIGFVIVTGLLYFLAFTKCFQKTRTLGKFRLLLLLLANILYGISKYFTFRPMIEYSLEVNTTQQWLNQVTYFLTQLYICFLSDIINPIWYLRLIVPMITFAPLFWGFYVSDSETKLLWAVFVTVFLNCLLLLGLKGYLEWKSFLGKLNLEAWSKIQTHLLDKMPYAIAIIDMDGSFVYTNAKTNEISRGDPRSLLDHLVDLKIQAHQQNQEENLKEVKSSESSEVHSILFGASQKAEILLKAGIYRKKEYNNLEDLLLQFRDSLAENIFTNEDYFTFNGKLITSGLAAKIMSLPSHQVCQIKISPILAYKKIVVLINDNLQAEMQIAQSTIDCYEKQALSPIFQSLEKPLNDCLNTLEKTVTNDNVMLKKPQKELLTGAINNCKYIVLRVNHMIDYSSMKYHELSLLYEERSLRETLKDCYYLLKPQAQLKGLNFSFTLDPKLPTKFFTDHRRVSQIIIHLLLNAFEFTLEGGEVSLSGSCDENNHALIEVTDTGSSIKAEHQGELFNKFLNIDYGQGSTGTRGGSLELIISNQLAKALGASETGGIRVESGDGHRTKFSFLIEDKVEFTKAKEPDLLEKNIFRKTTEADTYKDATLESIVPDVSQEMLNFKYQHFNKAHGGLNRIFRTIKTYVTYDSKLALSSLRPGTENDSPVNFGAPQSP